ncbi:MAG: hypothetical protein IJZ89_00445 [Clostridia bacterium]|nr:hypothetical protein [Clostridia bacterium]
MKRIIAMFFVMLFLVSLFTACGKPAEDAGDTDGRIRIDDYISTYVPTSETAETAKTAAPPFIILPENYDYKNYSFTFLNSESRYDLYGFIDPDMTGEVLDDTCFERNLIAEDKFNITISEETKPYDEIAGHAKNTILSDEDIYDVMYLPMQSITPMISESLFYDLLEIDELKIDYVWWDQQMIIRNIIGDRLFFATSDLNLTAMETTQCIFFNEDMVMELRLELPYQTAFDGGWTLDEMKIYSTASASLNGANDNITYAFAAYDNSRYLPLALGAELLCRDEDGRYGFTADSDSNYNSVLSAIIDYLGSNEAFIGDEADAKASFMGGSGMFLQSEIRCAYEMRNNNRDFNFGILPMPKNDIAQENYISAIDPSCVAFCIPNTNTDLERTGVIIDYLTYSSYSDLMPRYYDIHSPLKALGRQESRDILALIRGTRTCEVIYPYGWESGIGDALSKLFEEKNTDFSAILA